MTADDPDFMKVKIALIDNKLPNKPFNDNRSLEWLFTEITNVEPMWIPYLRKVNFFCSENSVSCVYMIIMPEAIPLHNGYEWVDAWDIKHDQLSPEDSEIFKTSLGIM